VKTRLLNAWDVRYEEALLIQERLRKQVVRRGSPRSVRLVAGADVSYDKNDNRFYAAVTVMTFPQLIVAEEVTASGVPTFPYIPGLLTFREGPILIRAFEKLERRPDFVIFDGQGLAHPRGFGLASHMGLLLDTPSIGCAKTRLWGEHAEPGPTVGSSSRLSYDGQVIGLVLRTRRNVKPVFVSIGHRISLKSAAEWVLRTCQGYRLPEPTRQAHLLVNRMRLSLRNRR